MGAGRACRGLRLSSGGRPHSPQAAARRRARISQHAALQVAYAANAASVTLLVAGAQLGAAFTFRRFLRAGASPATTAWTLLISGIASTSSFPVLLAVGAVATGPASGVALGIGAGLLAALPGWAVLAGRRSPAGRRRLQALAVRVLSGWRRVTARRDQHRRPRCGHCSTS